MKKKMTALLLAASCALALSACGKEKERVVIYTTINEDVIAHMTQSLQDEFPDYDMVIEYQSTGKLGAQLMAEGTDTEGDIIFSLAYGNLEQLDNAGFLADVSGYNKSNFLNELVLGENYLPETKTGAAIIVNPKVLEARGLELPRSYKDLLKPEYQDLICMPDPKATGSGYIFVKSLVNVWGEEETFAYFEDLSNNILQFTSGGSGVVNALAQEEAAIGLGLICNAVAAINEGTPLEIIIPEEGAPYGMYGQAIVKGKENRECVQKVFDYLVNVYTEEHCRLYYPEQIFQEVTFDVENYPENIHYADMSGDTLEEKERLLELWPA